MDAASIFFSGGRIADVVLGVMLVEGLLLLWLSRRPHLRLSAASITLALLPGFFLALALRAALVHADWSWIALALIGALASHLADMRLRFQTRSASPLNR